MAKGLTVERQVRQLIFEQRALINDIAALNPQSALYARKVDVLFANLGLEVAGLTKRDVQRLVRLVAQELRDIGKRVNTRLEADVEQYGVIAYDGMNRTFETAGFVTTAITSERVATGLRNSFATMGQPLTEGLSSNANALIQRVGNSIRDGWVRGLTNAQILRQIRGVRTMRQPKGGGRRKAFYRLPGSDIGVWRNQMETLVRTAANSYSNLARQSFAEQNDDLIAFVRYTAVLDNRTTFICMSLDGRVWTPDDPDIVRPPQHWNCRSTLVYLTEADTADDFLTRAAAVPKTQKGFEELTEFRQTDTQARSKIARTRGKQVRTRSFDDFLRNVPKTKSGNQYLKDLFGSDAAVRAFRAGRFNLSDLSARRGSKVVPLTKAQLRKKVERKKPPPGPRQF